MYPAGITLQYYNHQLTLQKGGSLLATLNLSCTAQPDEPNHAYAHIHCPFNVQSAQQTGLQGCALPIGSTCLLPPPAHPTGSGSPCWWVASAGQVDCKSMGVCSTRVPVAPHALVALDGILAIEYYKQARHCWHH